MFALQHNFHLPSQPLLHELLKNDFFTVTIDRERALVHAVRTNVRFASAAECDRIFAEVARVLCVFDRSRLRLLVDLREGPLTQDPSIEKSIGEHRKKIISGFAKVAILVRTVAGGLQVTRHAREDGIHRIPVFQTEENARAFLDH
jgi:hypothetical protein